MYRLVLYYLIFLIVAAMLLSSFGYLPYSPAALFFSAISLVVYSLAANTLFAKIFRVPPNTESVYITALILALIITPPLQGAFLSTLPFLIWASVFAMACKFIINIDGKHVFNPAAFAVALASLTINQSASWWISAPSMMIFTVLGGFLIIRKVRRFDVAIAFLVTAFLTMVLLSMGKSTLLMTLKGAFLYSPLFFFVSIMLTEPLTMPSEHDTRIVYGFLVGWLFAPQTHFGSFYFTPELALLAGNIYSYVFSPKGRFALKLISKEQVGKGVYDFKFETPRRLNFKPGQYMEWTLGLSRGDSRGNRRYFTLASSPTENNALLGIKFYPDSSRYKQELLDLEEGQEIYAGQLSGDFILPKNKNKKIVFVAGGIGITPFRSMLKYLIDRNEARPIIVLYANRLADEIVYTDVLEEAREKLGIKTVYALSDTKQAPPDWQGVLGHFTPQSVVQAVPDFSERTFYISGSHNMVVGFNDVLISLDQPRSKIKTDFFPGLA